MSNKGVFALVALDEEAENICNHLDYWERTCRVKPAMRLFVEAESKLYREVISVTQGYPSKRIKENRILSFGTAEGNDVCLNPTATYRDSSGKDRNMFSNDECYFSFNESKELCLHDTSDSGTTKVDRGHGVILADPLTKAVVIPKTAEHLLFKIGRGKGAMFFFTWGGLDMEAVEGAMTKMYDFHEQKKSRALSAPRDTKKESNICNGNSTLPPNPALTVTASAAPKVVVKAPLHTPPVVIAPPHLPVDIAPLRPPVGKAVGEPSLEKQQKRKASLVDPHLSTPPVAPRERGTTPIIPQSAVLTPLKQQLMA
ncbi:hypothetical protein B0T24DRAFT_272309 [Lasiosphaeria ovina]|uniref:Uncharacterized protein n=1 Tax=Lasiosphaeria ovina TaxID=92902 RepID=A0AAE0KCM8_9PEZI|nr:hypothetical protein B0T24DRAFT_272309 [Lasiosphaeria ovina]